MRRRLALAFLLLAGAGASGAPAGHASERLADVNATGVSLQVNDRGEALVTYTTSAGKVRHVLAWGAENATPPDPAVPQQQFSLDYAGGWKKYKHAVWASFANSCRPYAGPPLVYLVAACTAPDGSHWAIQSWVRVLPLRGVAPFAPGQGGMELHLSHWTGELAVLEVSPHWTYGGSLQGLFGRLTYLGRAVYGFRTPSEAARDANARYFYIDTFNPPYGPGWFRDGAKVTHKGDGGFCYSFAPLAVPPRGYAGVPTVSGLGERWRVTVMGPGVTPDLQAEGPTLGPYDPAAEDAYTDLFDKWLSGDPACAAERS